MRHAASSPGTILERGLERPVGVFNSRAPHRSRYARVRAVAGIVTVVPPPRARAQLLRIPDPAGGDVAVVATVRAGGEGEKNDRLPSTGCPRMKTDLERASETGKIE